MMNEISGEVFYDETSKKWNLYRVYNYHLNEKSEGKFQPAFVDYHEFVFDVLENELHRTPLNLQNRQLLISMLESLRGSIIGALKKDCLMRGKKTNNDELFDDE
jgi:hypothetical protein